MNLTTGEAQAVLELRQMAKESESLSGVELLNALDKCPHLPIPELRFDEAAADGMSEMEIRWMFPRFYAQCPFCMKYIAAYASDAHEKSIRWR